MIRTSLSVWLSGTRRYLRRVKIILLSLLAIVGSFCAGCSSGKKNKSSYRNYEGDSSPGIKMFEEKPGYPLNMR